MYKEKIDSYYQDVADNTGEFYKGTLRSGQVLKCDTSIVIIGDVNPGAKIIAKGNIVILGSLKGNAYAGAAGMRAVLSRRLTWIRCRSKSEM